MPICFAFGADISSLYSLLSIVTVSLVILPSTLNVKPVSAAFSSSSSISSESLILISFELSGKSISTSVNPSAVTFGIVPVGKSAGSVIALPYGSTYSTLALGSASSVIVILNNKPPGIPVPLPALYVTRIFIF